MRRQTFGWTGEEVPVIGQGTWQLRDHGRAEEALRRGLDLGMIHIDTAELYTGSEEVVGRAIEGRRDDVFLVSKVLPRHARRDQVRESLQGSLAKLGVDQLDVYLYHWRSGSVPLDETLGALAEAADAGLTRYVGVSNFDVEDLDEAKSILGARGIACNQVLYHLEDRGVEAEVLPWCRREDVAVVGYSPFGSGRFPRPGSAGRRVLDAVAEEVDATARQVALSFLTRDPLVFAIPKAEKVTHVEDNAAAGDLELTEEQVDRIEEAFPAPTSGLHVL